MQNKQKTQINNKGESHKQGTTAKSKHKKKITKKSPNKVNIKSN